MDKTFELVICIDKDGKRKVVLERNTIDKIDTLTTSFENSDEIRCFFSDKVYEFEDKYKTYMNSLSLKNNRKEQGDITIIGTIKKETRRIKVLYNKHIEVFEYIIRNESFQIYLKKHDFYEEYCNIQQLKNGPVKFDENTSFLIRKILNIYKQYAKEKNELPIDTIFKHMRKQNQILEDYQALYDKTTNEGLEQEQLEAYELEFIREKHENQKYNIEDIKGIKEIKGRQKVKKIGGGK
ncbi:MAG: hypothetical protein ACI31V_05415 [Bacilli bacterium]